MAQTISVNAIYLVCCFIETLLYGMAVVLFILSLQSLARKKRMYDRRPKMPLIAAAPVLFLFATLHMFGTWARTYIAYITFHDGSPEEYWKLIASPEKTATQVGQIGAIILADAMLVYRAWIIWGQKYLVVAVPTLTLIATAVCGIAFVVAEHQVNVHTSIFQPTVTEWTEAWLATSICTTGICTGLIVYKLLHVQRQLPRTTTTSGASDPGHESDLGAFTSRVIRIVVESAAIYSIVNLLYCVLYAAALNPEAWFSAADTPIASISFSLIIIRSEHVTGPSQPTSAGRTLTSAGAVQTLEQGDRVLHIKPKYGAESPWGLARTTSRVGRDARDSITTSRSSASNTNDAV